MSKRDKPYRFIFSGGGTGGHIYPAIAVANQLKEMHPDAEFLFVGAEGKMEMQKVPEAGYKIMGLPIAGIQRSLTLKNLSFPIKLIRSLTLAKKVVKNFKPDAVMGFGGYASGPLLRAATKMGVPALIQEQNSFAGLTNKWLKNKVEKICVSYDGMDAYFPANKLVLTGNPVRKSIEDVESRRAEALAHFQLDGAKKTVLILGGSLGARTLNEAMVKNIALFAEEDVQVLWQTGRLYYQEMLVRTQEADLKNVRVLEFIKEMELAYAAADIIISRAGALSVSEISLAAKPCIFVPSPNVAEDHQTKNAEACVAKDAAVMIKDAEAVEKMVPVALELLKNENRLDEMSQNIKALAKPNATKEIAELVVSVAK